MNWALGWKVAVESVKHQRFVIFLSDFIAYIESNLKPESENNLETESDEN